MVCSGLLFQDAEVQKEGIYPRLWNEAVVNQGRRSLSQTLLLRGDVYCAWVLLPPKWMLGKLHMWNNSNIKCLFISTFGAMVNNILFSPVYLLHFNQTPGKLKGPVVLLTISNIPCYIHFLFQMPWNPFILLLKHLSRVVKSAFMVLKPQMQLFQCS